jgi:CRP/FNR family transcriptional regulator, cyclic AMP receptor protein
VFDASFARQVLARCVLFEGVDPDAMEGCLACLRVRRHRRDETVFHQGDPGDALHVIASGAVKIVLPSPDTGEQAIIATLRSGDFFGELAILDGEPHSATVIALEPTETLVLARADFERLFETEPGLRRALVASLARELRRLTGHVEAMHFLDLRGRLAVRIAGAAGLAFGAPVPSGELRVPWPYTQAEVAGMVGGSRESVNRHLGELAGKGIIRVERDALVVPDAASLLGEVCG